MDLLHEELPPPYQPLSRALPQYNLKESDVVSGRKVVSCAHSPSASDLPPYDCTVSRSGTISRKLESVSDETGHISHPFRRNWHDVHAIVRGTKLEIWKPWTGGTDTVANQVSRSHSLSLTKESLANRGPRLRSLSMPVTPLESDLIKSYSLHGCVCGIASDYTKKQNTLRIIVETDQFLLHTSGAREAVDWLETIQKAIAITDPIDTRKEPEIYSTPSRRRMRAGRAQAYETFEASHPHGSLTLRQTRHRTPDAPEYPVVTGLLSLAREAIRTRDPSTGPATQYFPGPPPVRSTAPSRRPDLVSVPSTAPSSSSSSASSDDSKGEAADAGRAHAPGHGSHVTAAAAAGVAGRHRSTKDIYVCAVLNMNHPRTRFRKTSPIPLGTVQ